MLSSFNNPPRTRGGDDTVIFFFLSHHSFVLPWSFSQAATQAWQACLHLQAGDGVPGFITQSLLLSWDINPTLCGVWFLFQWVIFAEFFTQCLYEWVLASSFWASIWVCNSSNCCNYECRILGYCSLSLFSFHVQLLSQPGLSANVCVCVRVRVNRCLFFWCLRALMTLACILCHNTQQDLPLSCLVLP